MSDVRFYQRQCYNLMMKIIIIFLLLCIPTLVFAHSSIKFDTEIYDFGVVKKDQLLEHTFEFMNSGNEDLIISRLDATLGCTAAMASLSGWHIIVSVDRNEKDRFYSFMRQFSKARNLDFTGDGAL